MFRFFNTLFLSLVYTLLVFQTIIPMIDYKINKKWISENLCVNKLDTQKACHGHCYLNQQIAKAEEANLPVSTLPNGNHKIALQDISFHHLPENLFAFYTITILETRALHIETKTLLYNKYLFSVFHPPIV